MINEKQFADKKETTIQVLQLLFPGVNIAFTPRSLMLIRDGQTIMIDEKNFETL
jgi:hypothetical protein